MSSVSLVRVGGVAAILAGVLLVLGDLLNWLAVESETSAAYVVQSVVFLLAFALLLVGLVGLYPRLAEASGLLGLVGFLLALIGTAMVMGFHWDQTFRVQTLPQVAPTLLEHPPSLVNFGFIFSFVLFGLGWLLFGFEAYRTQVYPRAAVILLIVGVLLDIPPLPFASPVFAVAVAWLGFALLTGRGTSAEQTSQVR